MNIRKTYDQIFHFLCLRRRFLTLEGTLEKLPSSGSITVELGDIRGQINFLDDTINYFGTT